MSTCIYLFSAEIHFWCFGILVPFLGSECWPFLPPKVYFFLLHVKFPIDGYRIYHTAILIWGPGSLFLPFWPLQVYIFFIFIKFPIDWWVTWTISFLSLPVPSLGMRRIPNFFGLGTLRIKLQSILWIYMTLYIWKRTSFWIDLLGSQSNFFWIFFRLFLLLEKSSPINSPLVLG
jgi:hypothetical protein